MKTKSLYSSAVHHAGDYAKKPQASLALFWHQKPLLFAYTGVGKKLAFAPANEYSITRFILWLTAVFTVMVLLMATVEILSLAHVL